MGRLELFDPLTAEEIATAPILPPEEELFPIVPVPDDAPPMNFRHPYYGDPTRKWAYHDSEGRLVGFKLRFDFKYSDGEPGKEYLPVTYCQTRTGFGWRAQGFPTPRPLYKLPDIIGRAAATVMVCEGEKTADAAALLFPEMVTTTSPFGAQAAAKADWSPLAGRRVIVSPDNDRAGNDFCDRVCDLAYHVGAAEVMILATDKIGGWVWRDGQKLPRRNIPKGWDLADAVEEGWTSASVAAVSHEPGFLEPAPKPLVFDERGYSLFRMGKTGVEFHLGKGPWVPICGPLELVAETRDGNEENWGKLFEITNPDGSKVAWVMPMEHLAGDGWEYRRELLNRGLMIVPGRDQREVLDHYLSRVTTTQRARSVARLGWHGNVYVTSAGAIGQSPNVERVVYERSSQSKVGHTSGTLANWQDTVAKYAMGNSRLLFAISTAFAAPLVLHTKSESGGFHFVGKSSVGKTTSLLVAGSVWGGGGTGGYLRSWRATANGLEGIAADHCDALLCLDEMSQVRGQEAGACAYMLANGVGKTRANRSGAARAAAEWRLMLLSTGEVGLADKVAEDARGNPATAGQQVRIVDLEADAGAGLGIFENIHGHSSAEEFARHLKTGAEANYGRAGLVFVTRITQDVEAAAALAMKHVQAFVDRYRPTGKVDGQVLRAARKFGLVAAAGEMAIDYGIVPWPQGEAMAAAGKCFLGWLAERGTSGSLEDEQAVAHVRAFIEKHGPTRFFNSELDEDFDATKLPVRDRVGFIRTDKDGHSEFCFFGEIWKTEVCRGRDHKSVASALKARKLLVTGSDGRLNKLVRLKEKPIRVFVVKEAIMLEPPEEATEASIMAGFFDN